MGGRGETTLHSNQPSKDNLTNMEDLQDKDRLTEYRRRWKNARNEWEQKGIELEVRVWKRRKDKIGKPELKPNVYEVAKEIFK